MASGTNMDQGHQHRHQLWQQDMVLGSNLGQVVNMAPGGCAGHPDWHDPHGSAALGHQRGHKVVAQTTGPCTTPSGDINTGPLSCSRTREQDLASGHSPDPDISVVSGDQQAIHVSPFSTTLISSDPSFSPVCFSLSSTSHPLLSDHVGA